MKFTEHRDSNILAVKKYQSGSVTINATTLTKSCFLNQTQLIENWPCNHISKLTTELLAPMFELNPDVILLGTGEKQVFPSPSLFAYCSQKGIGLEVMANDAACRTYNVLTTEDREVVLALILEN